LKLAAAILLIWLILVPAGWGQAVAPAQPPQKTVHIQKIPAKIKVDGKLDEPVWATLTPITDFIQTDPDLGAPVSERTEALIFYDDDNLYFGFRCYDREPQKILHHLGAHDAITRSDSVDIFIDTFHDRRTGYYFSVNSRGIQFDAISNETRSNQDADPFSSVHDGTWDGIWFSAAVLQEWGWSAEIAIPFKSIRLPRQTTQTWGLNLNRSIVRKNEIASWQAVTRFDATMRPSKSGTMTGIENVHVGRDLELIPYLSTKYRSSRWLPKFDGPSANGGLDARYGLTQNLIANLAINPDFDDTEADEFTSQISRFEIFFPEKRKFFTEGANYFATPMNLFFSRRIGRRLPDGEPQRIYEGAKLTGKNGPWTIGAFEAVTERTRFTDPETGDNELSPGAVFGVLRLQRDILGKSAVGFMSANRWQTPTVLFDSSGTLLNAAESAQAVDLNVLRGDHISWASQFLVNTNALYPGLNGQHLGWQSTFIYNSEKFSYQAGGKFLGREVELSQIGFEPEVDRWSGYMAPEYKPFINRWGIRQLFVSLNYDEANGTRGELEDSGSDFDLTAQFKNFWSAHAHYSYDRVRFFDFVFCDSTPTCDARSKQRLSTTRLYLVPRYSFTLDTNSARVLSFHAGFTAGKQVQYDWNYYGYRKQFDLGMTARLGDHLRWELSGTQVRESLWNNTHFQNRNFLLSRWLYQFTPKLRARVLAQYEGDHRTSNLSINSLVAYDFTARSAFFLGYNRQKHSPLDRADLGNVVFVKLSYLFAF
jgi:uncharacterized protein DUF5916/cellulose/xylan binding protein with CBM9 domain